MSREELKLISLVKLLFVLATSKVVVFLFSKETVKVSLKVSEAVFSTFVTCSERVFSFPVVEED
jgi:hypothetical protein